MATKKTAKKTTTRKTTKKATTRKTTKKKNKYVLTTNKSSKTFTITQYDQNGKISHKYKSQNLGSLYQDAAKKWSQQEIENFFNFRRDRFYELPTARSGKFTYDVCFDDDNSSNSEGFRETIEYCKHYIKNNNGTKWSYFEDYVGGVASIRCNETGDIVYETIVKPIKRPKDKLSKGYITYRAK